MDVGCLCTAENRLMGAWSGLAFQASFAMTDRLGLTISWYQVCVGVVGGTVVNWAWGSQPGGRYDGVDVL